MHRYCKVLMGSAAAVTLVSCAVMLTTTEASAQFGFEGLIRGAMSHGYYGGYSRHHHGRVHESRHHRRSKDDDADDEDSPKDKGAESASKDNKSESASKDSKTGVKPASAVSQVNSGSNQGQPQTAASSTPSSPPKPNTDIPAFTPSR